MKHIIRLLLLITFSPFLCYSFSAQFDYALLHQRLRAINENMTDLLIINREPLIYQAWGVWTMTRSARQTAHVALNFADYPKVFRHVYRCEQITSPPMVLSPLGTWYLEGRAMRARVWAIGNIDTMRWNADSSEFRLIATQNKTSSLNKRWRVRLPNWLNFVTKDLKLAAIVLANGPDSCRVGILAQGLVNKPMPDWLIRLAVNVILPHIFEDFQKEVIRRYPEIPKQKPNEHAPDDQHRRKWWKFWD